MLPPPEGDDPRIRLLALTGALVAHDPPTVVGPVSAPAAADELLGFLVRHGYRDDDPGPEGADAIRTDRGRPVNRLDAMTWPEAGRAHAAGAVLLLPVGSTEQHGPHLPLTTDTDIAMAIAMGAAERRDQLVVAPALAYGSAGEHQGFAGTLSIGGDATETVLVELGRSAAHDYAHLVLVSTHGGNAEPVAAAVARLAEEGRPSPPGRRGGPVISMPAGPKPRSCWPSLPTGSTSTGPKPVTPDPSRPSSPCSVATGSARSAPTVSSATRAVPNRPKAAPSWPWPSTSWWTRSTPGFTAVVNRTAGRRTTRHTG